MQKEHLGSCLCGEIRFKLEGDFEGFYLCHCSHCRKDTGSAHAANLISSTARLEWLAGQGKLSRYQLPQSRHTHCFCSNCGSAMPYLIEQMMVIPAGCLDTEVFTRPDAHIFVASKAAWDHDLASIPSFDGFPA